MGFPNFVLSCWGFSRTLFGELLQHARISNLPELDHLMARESVPRLDQMMARELGNQLLARELGPKWDQ